MASGKQDACEQKTMEEKSAEPYWKLLRRGLSDLAIQNDAKKNAGAKEERDLGYAREYGTAKSL